MAVTTNTTPGTAPAVTDKPRRKRSAAKAQSAAVPPVPRDPNAQHGEWAPLLLALAEELQKQNLNRAVVLAQMAAGGRGPLVDHFAELGRRFAHLTEEPRQRVGLRLVKGGAE